jgi:hypothetical protein
VVTTSKSFTLSVGSLKMSFERTTRSASIPGASVPFRWSSNDA